MYDPAKGATLSTVTAGHTLDLAIYLLGGISEIAALTTIEYKSIELTDTSGEVANKTPASPELKGPLANVGDSDRYGCYKVPHR